MKISKTVKLIPTESFYKSRISRISRYISLCMGIYFLYSILIVTPCHYLQKSLIPLKDKLPALYYPLVVLSFILLLIISAIASYHIPKQLTTLYRYRHEIIKHYSSSCELECCFIAHSAPRICCYVSLFFDIILGLISFFIEPIGNNNLLLIALYSVFFNFVTPFLTVMLWEKKKLGYNELITEVYIELDENDNIKTSII